MAPPSAAEFKKLTIMDPEIATWLQEHPMTRPKFDFSDPLRAMQTMRANYNAPFIANHKPESTVTETQSTYTTRDGTSLRLAIFSPSSPPSSPLPLCVWYHGGGFCLGMPEMNASLFRFFIQDTPCIVVAPEYRLGPEHKFPTAINDCWDALQHIARHAADFNADPTHGFVIGGESAGAVLSSVLALLARDDHLSPPLTGVFLSAGSYTPPNDVPAQYKENYISRFDPVCVNAPGLDAEAKKAFDTCYAPDYHSRMHRAVLWKTGHEGLPRTYFQSCGLDINRDDSYIYEDILSNAGNETRLDVYPGAPHCFWLRGMNTVGMWRTWNEDSRRALAWLFGASE